MLVQLLHIPPHNHPMSIFARCCCYNNGIATASLLDAIPWVLINARNDLNLAVFTSGATIDGADNDAPHISVRCRHGPC